MSAQATLPPARQLMPQLSSSVVTVIQRDQFRSYQRSVADSLEQVPGVSVRQQGGRGGFVSISIRGAPSQQTAIYIDGLLQPGALGQQVNLAQIPLTQVESIEVYRTVPPGLLVQGSIGGAINIVTRKQPDQASSLSLQTGVGSWGQAHLGLYAGAHSGAYAGWLNLYHEQASNDFRFLNDNSTPDNAEDDRYQHRTNAGFTQSSVQLGGSRRDTHQWIQWQAHLQQTHKNLPTWNNHPVVDTYYQQQQWGLSVLWDLFSPLGLPLDSSTQLDVQLLQAQLHDPSSVVGLRRNDTDDQHQSYALTQTLSMPWQAGVVTWVNAYRAERYDQQDRMQQARSTLLRQQWLSSLGGEWVSPAQTWRVLGTVRRNQLIDSAQPAAQAREETQAVHDLHLGLVWQPYPGWQVKANLAQQNRVPNLFERYGDQGYFVGNADLQAEQAMIWDAALLWQGQRLQGQLSYFYRDSRNSIAPVYDARGVGRYINIHQAQHQGIELEGQWQLTPRSADTLLELG